MIEGIAGLKNVKIGFVKPKGRGITQPSYLNMGTRGVQRRSNEEIVNRLLTLFKSCDHSRICVPLVKNIELNDVAGASLLALEFSIVLVSAKLQLLPSNFL